MNILVTGGAGYIGSHAVRKLKDEGFNVIVFDNLTTGYKESVQGNAKFYEGDIRDEENLQAIFKHEKIDGVMHFAASSLIRESMLHPLKYYDNNITGTQVLLRVMNEHKVRKIVFSSTAAVYGDCAEMPILETVTPNPSNAYGETKLAIEKILKWCSIAHDINFVSLRYFNVAGAIHDGSIGEAHKPETHLIPLTLKVALGLEDYIPIYGNDYNTKDGTCVRDYVHVEDLIDAHILALKYLDDGGESEIFNLGSEEGFSVKQIIDAARRITKTEIKTQNSPRRTGDPSTLIASSEKAKEILKWTPTRTSIDKIIEDAWRWHKSHPNGYTK